jgi:hypothetical protein
MTTETNSALVPVSATPEETRKLNVKSLFFGAYAAAAVLAIYSLIQLVGSVFSTMVPYVAGGILFVTLTSIFLSVVLMLKKIRKSARKTIAVLDTYASIAVITVLGYFAAACVVTFQPGGNPTELWTNGALAAIVWVCLFGGGKWTAQLLRDDSKN